MSEDRSKRRELDWKARLSDMFPYSGLLQLLIYSVWFRLVFVLLVLFAVFMALFLPKIWVTTPKDYNPVVKVSGLDLLQAWSLKRSARAAAEAGDQEKALYAWRVAVANNQGNLDSIRGFLEYLLKHGERDETIGMAYTECHWLLGLTETNRNQVELVARVYDHYKLPSRAAALLDPFKSELSPVEEKIFLKSLFEIGQRRTFDRQWESARPATREDPELRLYRDAWLAGWGDPGESGDALARLKSHRGEVAHRELVARLELEVAHQRGDLDYFKEVLDRMVDEGMDRPAYHVTYWILLKNAGREDEAVRLAKNYPFPPESADNLIRFSDVLLSLGLKDDAMDLLTRNIPQFGYSESLWVKQATILNQEKKWEELKALAADMRVDLRVNNSLEGFSYYLEGLAEYRMKRYRPAGEAFERIPRCNFESPYLALQVAANLEKLDYHAIAKEMLVPLEDKLMDHASYWQALNDAGVNLRSDDLVFRTAERLYKMNPDNWITRFNYAASLISRRIQPAEAVKITVELLNQRPNDPGVRINHALALLLNGRTSEAQEMLQTISEDGLPASYASSYFLAWFEVFFNENHFDKALAMSEKINPDYLFNCENEWLQTKLRRIQGASR